MTRSFQLSLSIALLANGALLACESDVDSGCLSGPCGPGTSSTSSSSGGGGGGAGGEGGAGGAAPSCDGTPETGSFPCPVYEALKAKCHTCHSDPPGPGVPFSLLTFEDTRQIDVGKPRYVRMQEAIETDFMPLGSAPDLTPEEKQVLLDWLGSCGVPEPEGAGCECNDPAACP